MTGYPSCRTHPLYANAGETVRIFLGVGGPNFTSSFHVIGEVFDNVCSTDSVGAPTLTGAQTTIVPPGGATMTDFKVDRGGHYLIVDGPENDDIMHAGPAGGAANQSLPNCQPGRYPVLAVANEPETEFIPEHERCPSRFAKSDRPR